MKCSDWRLDISAYLDGNLEPSGCQAVEEHLGVCPECSSFYAEQEELTLALRRGLPDLEPPSRIWQQIESQLESQPTPGFWNLADLFRMPRLGYAGAALVLVLMMGLFLSDFPGTVGEEERYLAELDAYNIEVRGNPFLAEVGTENPFMNLGQFGTETPFERLGGRQQ
jgi:anti-sigma factor RsiW